MLMNLHIQQWYKELLRFFEIPKHILPTIKSSAESYGIMVHHMIRAPQTESNIMKISTQYILFMIPNC